ncbi:MAG: ORF6N domain-containing protein [Melioribacteraceae bacterium]
MKKTKEQTLVTQINIKDSIYSIRGMQVILDRDLAKLYGVKAIRLREQVKRNVKRFPEDFMFQLTEEEVELMVSQNAIPSKKHLGGYLPYVFSEQGVSMLSAILKSQIAVETSIKIIRTFVEIRKFFATNAQVFQRLENVETKLLTHQIKSDEKFEKVFKALEDKSITPKQGIFYDGQVFDAYILVADIIRTAKISIILIDNYVDDTVLKLFAKRRKNVKTTIYTKTISKILKQDLEKYNEQYEPIEIKNLITSHDRFLIVDEKTIYHFGASLKDLGKKWFAFSKLEMDGKEIIEKL